MEGAAIMIEVICGGTIEQIEAKTEQDRLLVIA
jgi:hypothetical protein